MNIEAKVVYSGEYLKDKEVRITLTYIDEDEYFCEEFCWITKEMLEEVLNSGQ